MTAQLNTLLRLRQFDVDRCQSQLAAAIVQERTLLDCWQVLGKQCEQQRADLETLTRNGPLNVDALRLRQRHLQLLKEQQSRAAAEVAAATKSTEQCRIALVAADQRRQVVEKLRERLLHETRFQLHRTESRELEEAWRPKSR